MVLLASDYPEFVPSRSGAVPPLGRFQRPLSLVRREELGPVPRSVHSSYDALGVGEIASHEVEVLEAVVTEQTEEFEPDTVIQELVRGYRLGDKLLRPAVVKVATR